MISTLVIGIGNTIRGDDGAGIRVAEVIAGRHADVDVLCVQQLSADHADTIARYDRLIVVDASVTADSVRVTPLHAADDVRLPRTHNVTPEGILALSAQLYDRVPSEALLVEVPAVSCDFSESLSPSTAAFAATAIGIISRHVTEN
jgi:hydrogenase maturation protease